MNRNSGGDKEFINYKNTIDPTLYKNLKSVDDIQSALNYLNQTRKDNILEIDHDVKKIIESYLYDKFNKSLICEINYQDILNIQKELQSAREAKFEYHMTNSDYYTIKMLNLLNIRIIPGNRVSNFVMTRRIRVSIVKEKIGVMLSSIFPIRFVKGQEYDIKALEFLYNAFMVISPLNDLNERCIMIVMNIIYKLTNDKFLTAYREVDYGS